MKYLIISFLLIIIGCKSENLTASESEAIKKPSSDGVIDSFWTPGDPTIYSLVYMGDFFYKRFATESLCEKAVDVLLESVGGTFDEHEDGTTLGCHYSEIKAPVKSDFQMTLPGQKGKKDDGEEPEKK
jgi:hypothetical protein